MSMRQGWTYNGKHFARTATERGGLRHFIDGKPVCKDPWDDELVEARFAEQRMAAKLARCNEIARAQMLKSRQVPTGCMWTDEDCAILCRKGNDFFLDNADWFNTLNA